MEWEKITTAQTSNGHVTDEGRPQGRRAAVVGTLGSGGGPQAQGGGGRRTRWDWSILYLD